VQRKTPAKQKSKNRKDEDEPIIYPKLEDEIFREVLRHAIQMVYACIPINVANKTFFLSLAHGHLLSQYALNSQLSRRLVTFICLVL
jgi:hypothetical protein